MKRLSFYFVSAFALFVSPVQSPAVDLAIGALSFYTHWEPSLVSKAATMSGYDTKAFLLAGPVVRIAFLDDWDISAVYLTTIQMPNHNSFEYSYSKRIDVPVGMSGYRETHWPKLKAVLLREDVDVTLGYKISQNFKLFCGYKYMMTKYTDESELSVMAWVWGGDNRIAYFSLVPEMESVTHSGGLGGSVSIPLVANMFFVINVSGLYAKTGLEMSIYDPARRSILTPGPGVIFYTAYGGNASISLAYYIESINTAIMLGGRYQLLRYNMVSDDPYRISSDDIYYGGQFSVIYYFSL